MKNESPTPKPSSSAALKFVKGKKDPEQPRHLSSPQDSTGTLTAKPVNASASPKRKPRQSSNTAPSKNGTLSNSPSAPFSTRMRLDLQRRLKDTCYLRRRKGTAPFTIQAVTEAALVDWLKKHQEQIDTEPATDEINQE